MPANLVHQRQRVVLEEAAPQRDELVQQNAESPHVARLSVGLALADLRTQVERRAHHTASAVSARSKAPAARATRELLGDSEVLQLEPGRVDVRHASPEITAAVKCAVRVDVQRTVAFGVVRGRLPRNSGRQQHVLGLDVSVQHLLLVQVLQSPADFAVAANHDVSFEVRGRSALLLLAVLDSALQVSPSHELQQKVQLLLCSVEHGISHQLHEVRVVTKSRFSASPTHYTSLGWKSSPVDCYAAE